MPSIKFTARGLEGLKTQPRQKAAIDYFDESIGGSFGLRLFPSGRKSWFVMYRFSGRLRRYTIGNYRDLPLADARQRAKDLLQQVAKGTDPAEVKQRGRLAETVEELCHQYIEKYAKQNKRTWEADERMLAHDVLPEWKYRKAKDVSRRDVIALLNDIVARPAPVHANRVLALVRKVFNWAIEQDLLSVNPCWNVKRPTDERSRRGERVLKYGEIRQIWKQIEKQDSLIAGIFKLRLLTAQRGDEVRSIRWTDIDLEAGRWTIPNASAKNKESHTVPLSRQAQEVIEILRAQNAESDFVFPSPTVNGHHIDNIHKAIDRIRKNSKVVFVDRDLRRTVATYMAAELRVPRLVIAKILNHKDHSVTQVYDRHGYEPEKREALQAWADHLDRILNGKATDAGAVVTMRTGRTALAVERRLNG